MNNIHVIDLMFLADESIASFLIETSEGPVVIEAGPESTWTNLKAGIEKLGYEVSDIKHVFLTHIHFDHAGAAWKFAETGAKIYVHPIGLPHLAAPEKLWNSAKQIYGDAMERLWGSMEPIPENQLIAADHGSVFQIGSLKINTIYTPGHAIHHNAYQVDDVIFTGDVAGVSIEKGPVQPPCPPPDIHIENWKESIAKLRTLNPKALYLTHFDRIDNPLEHLDELEKRLDHWSNWIKPHFEAGEAIEDVMPLFVQFTKEELINAGLSDRLIDRYEYANPAFMSVTGLYRYWKLKEQGRI